MVADWRGHLVVVRDQSSGFAGASEDRISDLRKWRNLVQKMGSGRCCLVNLEGNTVLYACVAWLGCISNRGVRLFVRNFDVRGSLKIMRKFEFLMNYC